MNEKQNYVDTIENAITDYCIRNKVKPGDIPFSVFELSIHINEYILETGFHPDDDLEEDQ